MTPAPTRRQWLRAAGALTIAGGAAVVGQAQEAATAPANDLISPEAQAAIDRGLAYLANGQSADGSYSAEARGISPAGNVAVTGLAGLALMAGGHQPGRGRYGRVVAKAADYVVARGASNAGLPGYLVTADQMLAHSSMYQHGFGALFLAEVAGMVPEKAKQDRLRATLERAVGLTRSSQNSEGGWRYEPRPTSQADVSVTVAQLMALRAAKNAGVTVPKAVIDRCVRYIRGCQMEDGGFCYMRGQENVGSAFARSAAAVVGLFSAGIYDGREIDRGLRYLLRFTPGRRGGNFGESRADHYYYGHYYAALAMWTAGGNYWAEWFPAVRDELLGLARQGGGVWGAATERGIGISWHGPAYSTAMACIVLQLPNNYLPIMQK